MDINKIIFSRTAPSKKVEIVKALSISQLLSITPEAITRMVKETGSSISKSRNKELRISSDLRTGNNWNSEVEGVRLYKGHLSVDFYLQFENTDTNTNDSLENFLNKGDYRGSVIRSDRYGNDRHYYFTYNEADKAEFVKSLLLEYLNRKYKDRLS